MTGLVLSGLCGSLGAGAAEFKVDPAHSRLTVDVKATGDNFTAVLTNYQARIVMDAEATPTEAVFNWDFHHLLTGKAKRDKAMLEWIEDTKFSKASFTMEKWETREGKAWALGTMNLHGVKQKLSFPVTVTRKGEEVTLKGSAALNYKDYGLKIFRMMVVFTVDPSLQVDFELKGKLTP